MPGRVFTSQNYRFGFNGMEKDDDVAGSGNSYTTFWRGYDPRLGRWFSTDPVFQPWQSPYSSFGNNPIFFNDPFGNCEKCPKEGKEGDTYTDEDNDFGYTYREKRGWELDAAGMTHSEIRTVLATAAKEMEGLGEMIDGEIAFTMGIGKGGGLNLLATVSYDGTKLSASVYNKVGKSFRVGGLKIASADWKAGFKISNLEDGNTFNTINASFIAFHGSYDIEKTKNPFKLKAGVNYGTSAFNISIYTNHIGPNGGTSENYGMDASANQGMAYLKANFPSVANTSVKPMVKVITYREVIMLRTEDGSANPWLSQDDAGYSEAKEFLINQNSSKNFYIRRDKQVSYE